MTVHLPGTTPTYWEENLTIPMLSGYHKLWENMPSPYMIATVAAMCVGYKPSKNKGKPGTPENPVTHRDEVLSLKETMLHHIPGGRVLPRSRPI